MVNNCLKTKAMYISAKIEPNKKVTFKFDESGEKGI